MTRHWFHSTRERLCALTAAFLGWSAPIVCGADPPFFILESAPPLPIESQPADVLSTLKPVVRTFDFEQGTTGPGSLPPQFYRYVAPGLGFPPFGEMRIAPGQGYLFSDDDTRTSGSALEFSLQAGSMSARIGTSVIPVIPLADYVVACRVRTQGLNRARAKIVAWLCDASGKPIPESRVESRAANTLGRWETISLEVPGLAPQAADLVFELLLEQPAASSIIAGSDVQPQPQDVSGQAWFDDIVVSHLPRVSLRMRQPGHIVDVGNPAEFVVEIQELASRGLAARLRVVDDAGRVIRDVHVPVPRGREAAKWSERIDRCGWYRAVLDVISDSRVARRRWLDFIVQPESEEPCAGPFGIALDGNMTFAEADLAANIGAGTAIVPAWSADTTLQKLSSVGEGRAEAIERLLRSNASVIFDLTDPPEELQQSIASTAGDALALLQTDPTRWRPYLDDLLMQFGLSIDRWLADGANGSSHRPPTQRTAEAQLVRNALARFVPLPRVHLAWPVSAEPPAGQTGIEYVVHVPASVPATSLPEFLHPWTQEPSDPVVMLDGAVPEQFAPRTRAIDAMQRALYAWRAGSRATVIEKPWNTDHSAANPDIVAAVWRTLNRELEGMNFVADLTIGPHAVLWVASNPSSGAATVIMWSNQVNSDALPQIELQLGHQPLRVVDAFGNESFSSPRDGEHTLALTQLPTFIRGVNRELVVLRSGVSIEPAFVPAAYKVHEHHVVISNPWDAGITGTLRIASESDLHIVPAQQSFIIPPRETVRLPVSLVPQRGIVAGHRIIDATLEISADAAHTLRMNLGVVVGLKDIEVNVATSTVNSPGGGPADLLISAAVTNLSSHPVHLDVDLLAANVSQMRRTIAALQPGQTQTRVFRIPAGAQLLDGQVVRLGVSHRDGVARLNRLITIGQAATVTAVGESDE